ncbi:acyl-CoA N-acyltransferase [Lentinula lateritia]|uniref:Acyl-CoA N-acyltransferase n=1 Tax=Lentinula lateritia TaxID=40482 RepID=A0ABQ8VXK8_9AGAR|nr:acyl-CoA N-acyltransferase [Lentinula lateritia]KAJ4501122.1 acyl-CoA N-acyltransferase [Lentinula lateritia]
MSTLAKDNNFCFPIPNILETEKLELVPFVPSYATDLIQGLDESSWIHVPVGPYSSPDEFVEKFWNERIRPNDGSYLFVALNKSTLSATDSGEVIKPTVAGMAGYVNTETENLCTEIFIFVLPQFRHTHVASHAVGLLLRYALNLPNEGGLGLRRVEWSANVTNPASIRLAIKMGMKVEGVRVWTAVLPMNKTEAGNGRALRKGDPRAEFPGRDSTLLALCWDDWDKEGKEKVEKILT